MRIKLEKGITFNGKHSYDDYRMLLAQREIGIPSKQKLLESVPYSNKQYDFSTIYGAQSFEQREITYTFNLFNANIAALEQQKINCINWLMGAHEQVRLEDDDIEEYYFLGECRHGIECTLDIGAGIYELKVTFTCYPFKIGTEAEGNQLWDSFNFLTDYFINTKFTMVDSKREIILYNASVIPICPTVICTIEGVYYSYIEIILRGVSFSFGSREFRDEDFILEPGFNTLTVTPVVPGISTGNNTLEFRWYREVL